MSDYLITDQGVQIYEGSIVVLARFPNLRWIVHNGWYTFQGNQYMGWYFSSIPSNTILPLNNDDLVGIQVISGSGPCPSPSPCPPQPGGGFVPGPPPGEPFTHEMRMQLERAWITVDTLEQRNRLNCRLVPNGKVVKVNDVDGVVKYYSYDQSESTWVEETFGIDTSSFVSKDELATEVENQIQNIDLSPQVTQVIETNKTVQNNIKEIAVDALNWGEVQD